MHLQPLLLSSLLSLTTAHFQTTWPPARGFSEKTASNFPCGGFDSVSNNNRTDFPIGGSPIELNLEHTQTNLAVYIAIASDPGSSYNIVLRPQFAEQGPGSFCIGAITLPSNVNVSGDGVPATIQVVSNGDPTGGLYQCSDVTLKTGSLSQSDYSSHCTNGTNVKVTTENISGNPNGTSSGSPSASGSGSAASATVSKGLGVAHPTAVSWAMGAVGIAGMALL